MVAAAPNVKGIFCRASRFRIKYTSPDGHPMAEQFTCILSGFPTLQAPKPPVEWTLNVSSCKAHAAEFDGLLPLFGTIESSVKSESCIPSSSMRWAMRK